MNIIYDFFIIFCGMWVFQLTLVFLGLLTQKFDSKKELLISLLPIWLWVYLIAGLKEVYKYIRGLK